MRTERLTARASPDHVAWLSGGPAAVSAVLAGAGVPAGIAALVLGVTAIPRIGAGEPARHRMAATGRLSGVVAAAMYAAAAGINVIAALYHYG